MTNTATDATNIFRESTPLYKSAKAIRYTETASGCWECVSHCANFEGYVRVYRKGRLQALHRYVYEELIGEIPAGNVIMHRCDNPSCMNPAHLLAGTQDDNMADMSEKGRSPRGERSGRAKLTEEQVRAIIADPRKPTPIAKEYGVSYEQIARIKKGQRWAHLQPKGADE